MTLVRGHAPPTSGWRRLKRIWAASLVLAAWGCLALVLAGFGGPFVYALDVLAHLRLHLIVLAGVLVLLARGWGARVPAVLGLGLGLAGLGPVWQGLPQGAPAGQAVTVLFGNVDKNNPDPAALDRALVDYNADVLILSGLPRGMRDGPTQIRAHYAHHLVPVVRRQTQRSVFWSQLPLALVQSGFGADGTLVGAVVQIGAAPGPAFTILSVHYARPTRADQQRAQVQALATISPEMARPLVVLGDFDATPWSHALAETARLTDTQIVGGLRLTWWGQYRISRFRLPEPLGMAIDHVLVSPGVGVDWIESVDLPGSDHRGILVQLRLPPG